MTDDDHPSFAAVMTYVRSVLPGLTAGQQAVALTVASHYSRRDGHARPSQRTLAAELGWHEDTVYRALRAVEQAGVWVADRRHRRATQYRFPVVAAIHNPRAPAGSTETGTETRNTRRRSRPRVVHRHVRDMRWHRMDSTWRRDGTDECPVSRAQGMGPVTTPTHADRSSWPQCITTGCTTDVDPWDHNTRCLEHRPDPAEIERTIRWRDLVPNRKPDDG